MRRNTCLAVACLFSIFASALELSGQEVSVVWKHTYAGGVFGSTRAALETADGGFVYAGQYWTGQDYLKLWKVDSKGVSLWTKSYDSPEYGSLGRSLERTLDGGFLLCAENRRWLGYEDRDIHLIKTDSAGSPLWEKIYSDSTVTTAKAILRTYDGGFVVAGATDSAHPGSNDMYLLRIDSAGSVLWQRAYGAAGNDEATAVEPAGEGGFAILGHTDSFGNGGVDVLLVRANSEGDTVWTRTYGGPNDDYGTSLTPTGDGGFVLAGYTSSYGAGGFDVYAIRITKNGDTLWTRTFGGTANDLAYSVDRSADSNFVLVGSTESFLSGGYSRCDCYALLITASGESAASLNFYFDTSPSPHDGDQRSRAYDVIATADGKYTIAGGWSFHNDANEADFSYAALAKLTFGSAGIQDSAALYSRGFWQPTNGPYGGNIIALCADSNGSVFAISTTNGMSTDIRKVLYRSTDNGGTWMRVDSALKGAAPAALAVDAHNNLYAAGSGLFRSTDGGTSWSQIDADLPTHSFRAIGTSPTGSVYVGGDDGFYRSSDYGISWSPLTQPENVWHIAANARGIIFVGGPSGLFRSTDSGTSWHASGSFTELWNYAQLAASQTGDVFLAAGSIFRTTDDGSTWTTLPTDPLGTPVWVSIGMNNAGTIFAGASVGGALIKSTDHGDSWQRVNTDSWTVSHIVLSIAASCHNYLFVGNIDGVYRSGDGGSIWVRSCDGIREAPVISMAVNTSNVLFAGTWGSGVFRSTDRGATWIQVNAGLTNSNAMTLAADYIGNVYVGTPGGGTFRSSNNGDSWTSLPASPSAVKLVADESNYIYAGAEGFPIYRSSDSGDHWVQTSYPDQFMDDQLIASAGVLLAGRGSFYRSTDHGTTWIPTFSIRYGDGALAASPTGNIWAVDLRNGVYTSTDGGETWTRTDSGSANSNTLCATADIQDHVFVGGDAGVFLSANDGISWEARNTGLPSPAVRALIAPSDGDVYIGTGRGGVSRWVQKTTAVRDASPALPTRFRLLQNYPNPFNPLTRIRYFLPQRSFIALSVYNMLGQLVARLEHGVVDAGDHETIFDASELSSGIYFCRLQVGDAAETRKLLLLK